MLVLSFIRALLARSKLSIVDDRALISGSAAKSSEDAAPLFEIERNRDMLLYDEPLAVEFAVHISDPNDDIHSLSIGGRSAHEVLNAATVSKAGAGSDGRSSEFKAHGAAIRVARQH